MQEYQETMGQDDIIARDADQWGLHRGVFKRLSAKLEQYCGTRGPLCAARNLAALGNSDADRAPHCHSSAPHQLKWIEKAVRA